jgi:hypothetical protein
MRELLARLQRAADAADADARTRAVTAFVTSVRYEWMFWQQAWEGQRWPVGDETAGPMAADARLPHGREGTPDPDEAIRVGTAMG